MRLSKLRPEFIGLKGKKTKITDTSSVEYTDRCVTNRTYVHLPLFIYGVGRDPFHEETRTICVDEAGGLILMARRVQPGQRILVTNQGNDRTQACVIVSVSAQAACSQVEFKFLTPAPQFWHGLEIGNSFALRNWSEYFIEALIPLIRADRAPALKVEIDQCAIPLAPMRSKIIGLLMSSGEDRPVFDKSGGPNASTQQ
jgi:hypothetical protein